MIGIYKITNPNGKVYIGQSKDIDKRFSKYKNGICKSQYALFASLIKYGWVNHTFETIETCDVSELNNKERHYQELYDVLSGDGLNCVLVNSDGSKLVFSEESMVKMSNIAKERIVSAARRQHQKNIMTGRKYTDDHKAKIGKANKGKIHWWNKGVPQSEKQKKAVSEKLKIPILQFDLDGSFIKEWDSTKSASIFYNVSTSCICACINGKSKTSIGFVWSKK